jgi:beta-xylosidase
MTRPATQSRSWSRSAAASPLLLIILMTAAAHAAGPTRPAATTQGAPVAEQVDLKYPWVADQGDGTYRNPVLCADYSDPDVIRVGDDFWATASSFTDTPGLPILHSRDLVNWTIVNHAIENVPVVPGGLPYDKFQPGCGVWAPSIRYHDNRFWIFFPTPDEGVYLTTATDPRAKWSEPVLMLPGKGIIDPCPLWDDDGKAYLVHAYARSRSGIKHRLRVVPMSTDGMRVLGEGKVVFEDPQRHPTMEGPKFYKRGGTYYILAPAGGVSDGWQVALRSKNVYGPYEDKIVLEQGNSSPINGPHQGALVDTPDGKQWWFVHFQERLPYGRITHLQPVTWTDGWPIMGEDRDGNGIGEPVLRYRKPTAATSQQIAVPQTSDDFDGDRLGLQWQWHANHEPGWHSLSARPGWLRLNARPTVDSDLAKSANLLLQKIPATSFTIETVIDAAGLGDGSRAGLTVTGKKHADLSVERRGGKLLLVLRIDNRERAAAPLPSTLATLRCTMNLGGDCTFSYSGSHLQRFEAIGPVFQAVEGVWIGSKVGLFCVSANSNPAPGSAEFDCFRFR